MTSRPISPITRPFDAHPRIPGSKSFTNRALIASALAVGTTELRGVLLADDTEAMLDCLHTLGIRHTVDHEVRAVTVHGVGGDVPSSSVPLNVRQSGTTARFLPPMVALGAGDYTIDGDAQMRARPMGDLVDALAQIGVSITSAGSAPGHLPLVIHAPAEPGIAGGCVRLRGDVSSQFLSGLLLSAPYYRSGLQVELTTELVSKPYLAITAATMAAFGVVVTNERDERFRVEPGRYVAPPAGYVIEPDASAASYFFGAAAICGGRVAIDALGHGAVQGDVRFADILGLMGAEVRRDASTLIVEAHRSGRLHGIDVDMADCSDTAPTLAAVAAFADSPTRVTGIGFIRRKETDRIGAVVAQLRRCGVDADEEADGFVVRPSPEGPVGAAVHTYDDHRMAMSFSLLGLRVPGVVIEGAECVSKTFPDFFDVLETLR